MSWTNSRQERLNHLRNRELAGTLTEPEQVELEVLMADIEAEEAQSLAPAMQQLHAEALELEREIAVVEAENEESARLLARQQALVADGQRFLIEFEQRRTSILDGLARLTRTPLPI
jgi:ATPase subunit of ABC transporter with duplicated ATPase domains